MLDFGKILEGLKGKALDFKDIELLRHAYDLQQEVNDRIRELYDIQSKQCAMQEKQIRSQDVRIRNLETELESAQQELERVSDESDRIRTHVLKTADATDCRNLLAEAIKGYAPGALWVFEDLDRRIGLPQGSAKKYLEEAALSLGLQVEQRGENTIVFQEYKSVRV